MAVSTSTRHILRQNMRAAAAGGGAKATMTLSADKAVVRAAPAWAWAGTVNARTARGRGCLPSTTAGLSQSWIDSYSPTMTTVIGAWAP
ncbi:hypothetical protein ACHAXR_011132 [Thalassiosira sp. AJA248-18]